MPCTALSYTVGLFYTGFYCFVMFAGTSLCHCFTAPLIRWFMLFTLFCAVLHRYMRVFILFYFVLFTWTLLSLAVLYCSTFIDCSPPQQCFSIINFVVPPRFLFTPRPHPNPLHTTRGLFVMCACVYSTVDEAVAPSVAPCTSSSSSFHKAYHLSQMPASRSDANYRPMTTSSTISRWP
jgi:hypothetical protein